MMYNNKLRLRQQPPEFGWGAPPSGMYKINVDGATSKDNRPSGVSVVIRDCRDLVVASSAKICLLRMEWRSLKP